MTVLRLLILTVLSVAILHDAQAHITDKPRFKVNGVVIVWSGGEGDIQARTPIANAGKSVTSQSQTSTDFPAHIVQTIALENTPSQTVHALDQEATASKSFFVASNTAFNIDAELTNSNAFPPSALTAMPFKLSVSTQGDGPVRFGTKAQLPHSAGADSGMDRNLKTLADIQTRRTIFRGNQKTAARVGTISEQSVKFTMQHASAPATSNAEKAQITLTVFVP